MDEYGNFPSVMEMSYEVPHHIILQQQDGDNKFDQGPSPSTTPTSTNLFNNMKMSPILDSYSESSYETAHETLSFVLEESDDVPSSAIIHVYDHGMIEHGDICTYISPTHTYEEMPQLPCEESHHHMSDMSDSTIRDIESISYEGMSVTTSSPTLGSMPHILCEVENHLSDSTNHMSESIKEGMSEPKHLVSEVVDTACEATMISKDLTSSPSVFSSLVPGLLHDDTPILNESIPPMETTMAMVDDDAPPHGSIKMKMTTTWSSTPHLQHMSDAPKVR